MSSGIYVIKNMVNGKEYVGSSVNVVNRRRSHFNRLRAGKHRNGHLQRAYNKYGESAFEFSLIEKVDSRSLKKAENWWFAEKSPEYNIQKDAFNRLGWSKNGYDGIAAYDSNGNIVGVFTGALEAGGALGVDPMKVHRICNKSENQWYVGGYTFERYKGSAKRSITPPELWRSKKQSVLCLEDGIYYKSVSEAAEAYDMPRHYISRVISQNNGRTQARGKRFIKA